MKNRNLQNDRQQHHHTDRQRREQAEKKWSDFLNSYLGVLGFPLGLACLTTKTPSFNAVLCLLFLVAMWSTGRDLVPKHFQQRKLPGSSRANGERSTFKDNLRFWLGTLPAVFGYLYLCFIAASHQAERVCSGIPGETCRMILSLLHAYVGAPGT